MNWGRWIIDCSGPGCRSALEVKPAGPPVIDRNGVVQFHPVWGDLSMRCWDCGWTTRHLAWPADPFGIEAILYARPDEKTRNWFPGETLDALLLENIAHGLMPPTDGLEPGGSLMITWGDVIVGGSILATLPPIEAAFRRREIGD